VLSLAQVHTLVFDGLNRSRVSRRIAALIRAGWVTRWEQPVARGGRPGFVVPSVTGLRWALDRIVEGVASFPSARLVATMLRRDGRSPLPFPRGIVPPFFAHLHEVNDILVSLQLNREVTVLWASSWNRPFPNAARNVVLPQPDGVLIVATSNRAPALVFLEHDRGGESLEHFRTRKADRYRALAQRPGLLAELTGFDTFRVCVTVRAADPAATANRVATLRRCVHARLAGHLMDVFDLEAGVPSAVQLADSTSSPGCDAVSHPDGIRTPSPSSTQ